MSNNELMMQLKLGKLLSGYWIGDNSKVEMIIEMNNLVEDYLNEREFPDEIPQKEVRAELNSTINTMIQEKSVSRNQKLKPLINEIILTILDYQGYAPWYDNYFRKPPPEF